MIAVQRTPKPEILERKEAEWTAALLQAKTKMEKERCLAKYRHQEIQEALDAMFCGKCAYCESEIEHVSDAHIEHYRPKSRRPELAFRWDNLLLACGKCNSTRYKGDHFPEAEEGGPLLNPCLDDPNEHLRFDYDPQARLASVYGVTRRGETTEVLLGLNRPELRKYRSGFVTKIYVIAQFAPTNLEARQVLEEATQADAEYAAFARRIYEEITRRFALAPPEREDETEEEEK